MIIFTGSRRNFRKSPTPPYRSRDDSLREKRWVERRETEFRRSLHNQKPHHFRPSSSSRTDAEVTPKTRSKVSTPDAPKKHMDVGEENEKDDTIKELREELLEKTKELKAKKKEITGQTIEINTLKKKKEKDGILTINDNLNKKNNRLKLENAELKQVSNDLKVKVADLEASTEPGADAVNKGSVEEVKSLEKTLKRVRKERDAAKDELKRMDVKYETSKETIKDLETKQKAAEARFEEELSRLEGKLKKLDVDDTTEPKEISSSLIKPRFPATKEDSRKVKDNATSKQDFDSSKDDSTHHKISSSGSDSSHKSPVLSRKRKHKEVNQSNKKPKLSSTESEESHDISANALVDADKFLDDSFNNLLPVSDLKFGRYIIKNFENKNKEERIAPPAEIMKSTNQDCVVTTLNGKISFISLGEKARQKHDAKTYGVKPCALHPYCSNMLYGGEDISYVYVCAPTPTFHKNYEKRVWVCFYHGKASFEGHEVQTQQTFEVTSTPKTQKIESPAADAPFKAPAPAIAVDTVEKTTKSKAVKAKLEERLNSTSSNEASSEEDSPVKSTSAKTKSVKKSKAEDSGDEK